MSGHGEWPGQPPGQEPERAQGSWSGGQHPPPGPSPSSSGINAAIVAGLAAVAVLVLAIGYLVVTDGDGGDDSAGATTATDPAAEDDGEDTDASAEAEDEAETQRDLTEALLTLDDFEDGWEVGASQPDPDPPQYDEDPECRLMFDILGADSDSLEARFELGDTVFVAHYIEEADEEGTTSVTELAAAVSACPEYSYTFEDANEANISQSIEATDELAEASLSYSRQFRFAWADDTETYGATFRVAWERDGVRSALLYVESMVDGDESSDYLQSEAEALAIIADARLQDVLSD